MKKGQQNKALSPNNTLEQNLEVAMWGRFAGTKALEAYMDVVFGVGHYRSLADMNALERLRREADVFQLFIDAITHRDAQFFRDLAGIVELPKSPNEFADVAPDYANAIAIYDVWKRRAELGTRKAEITYAEMLEYLNQQNPDGINEQQLTRIVKATGMQLKRGKPGPKASKKKTAGKGRA